MLRPKTDGQGPKPREGAPLPATPVCPGHWCNNFSAILEVGESGLMSGVWDHSSEPSRTLHSLSWEEGGAPRPLGVQVETSPSLTAN